MHREYHSWFSPSLRRDMELLLFGHGGAKVVAFPTSQGRFYDWESRGLVGALRDPLERGHVQICCVDSIDSESWYAGHRHPADRARRQCEYDAYVLTEVLPFLDGRNPTPFTIATGASFGGYHAVNFALRHPDRVNRVLGMSGIYDIRRFVGGYYDDVVYFNNPCDFVAHEHDRRRLALLRRLDVVLAVGRDDPLLATNRRLSQALWDKGVWHALRVWDGFAHDWPVWEKMLHLYLSGPD
jgi:esterase/lipase superfamily enzyme